MATPIQLHELIAALQRLESLRGVDRVNLARELTPVARATLAAEGDLGVWQATRREPQGLVAAQLGIGLTRVENAVTRHRKRSTQSHETRRPRVSRTD